MRAGSAASERSLIQYQGVQLRASAVAAVRIQAQIDNVQSMAEIIYENLEVLLTIRAQSCNGAQLPLSPSSNLEWFEI
jgi:hypothetical protein